MPQSALNGINDHTMNVCARSMAFQNIRAVSAAPTCSFQMQLLGLLGTPAGDDLAVCASCLYRWRRLIRNSFIARTTTTITRLVEEEQTNQHTNLITLYFLMTRQTIMVLVPPSHKNDVMHE